RAADPADLFHAVIELVPIAFRVAHISVPVRARHIAAITVDLDSLARLHPLPALDDLLQAADLPGDLVDHMRLLQPVHHLEGAAREQHEGVVIAVEAREIADGLELALMLFRHAAREVERVRNLEAEQIGVEIQRLFHVFGEIAEMAEPADAERAVEQDAADVEFTRGRGFHGVTSWDADFLW